MLAIKMLIQSNSAKLVQISEMEDYKKHIGILITINSCKHHSIEQMYKGTNNVRKLQLIFF